MFRAALHSSFPPASRLQNQAQFRRPIRTVVMAVNAVREATPQEAWDLCKSSSYAYLDVRTADEFKAGHAPGATNIPVMLKGPEGMTPNPNFAQEVKKKYSDIACKLVVGCKSGARSTKACDILSADYTALVNVKGGFDAWGAAGLPVEK